jgi:ABC-type transport system involved in multi-copper enzyme maturation permease subunit
MRTLLENPLLRYHLLGATRHRWRRQPWLYGAAVLGIGLVYLLVLQLTVFNEASIFATLGLALFVMCIAAPLMAYNLFSLEYEKQTWESLALTRLTAREIFWGKYGAALARVALTTLLFAPFLLTTHSATTYVIVAAFTALFSWGALLVSVGLWLSFKLKRTLTTAATLYAGQVFVLMLFPFLYLLFSEGSDPTTRAVEWVLGYRDGMLAWVASLFEGNLIIFANPFDLASRLDDLCVRPSWWGDSPEFDAYTRGLRYMLWGFAQSAMYLGLAAIFAGLTYRGVKISWRK